MNRSKLPSQTLLIFGESSKMWVVERYRGGRQHPSYWLILAAFFQSLGVIFRIAHSIQYRINSLIPQFHTVGSFISLFPWSFSNDILVLYPFFIARYNSLNKWLDFIALRQRIVDFKSVHLFFTFNSWGTQTSSFLLKPSFCKWLKTVSWWMFNS